MRNKIFTLAVAAMLAITASGAVAAGTGALAADSDSATALPDNHSVNVLNADEVSEEEVEQAITTAWGNEDVQQYFTDGAAVHFEVWASELNDSTVHVKIGPKESPDETRVIASIDLDRAAVVSVSEPVTLNESNAISINASSSDGVTIDGAEYDLNRDEQSSEDNRTRYTAERATHIDLNESSIEPVEDGTFTIEVESEEGSSAENTFRINTTASNQTSEDE